MGFAKVVAGALPLDTIFGHRTKTMHPSLGTHIFSLICGISGKIKHRRKSMLGLSVVEDPKLGLLRSTLAGQSPVTFV